MGKKKNIVITIAIIVLFVAGYYLSQPKPPQQSDSQYTPADPNRATQKIEVQTPTDLASAIKPDDHVRGSTNPQAILIEYGDFECPYCKAWYPTGKRIVADYGQTVAFIYRHYPIPIHTNARKEAEASECIAELGGNEAFWKFHDAIYERTKSYGLGFSIKSLGPLATEVGVNEGQFLACLNSGKYGERIDRDLREGGEVGVGGTPTMVIIGPGGFQKVLVGAHTYQTLTGYLREQLHK